MGRTYDDVITKWLVSYAVLRARPRAPPSKTWLPLYLQNPQFVEYSMVFIRRPTLFKDPQRLLLIYANFPTGRIELHWPLESIKNCFSRHLIRRSRFQMIDRIRCIVYFYYRTQLSPYRRLPCTASALLENPLT